MIRMPETALVIPQRLYRYIDLCSLIDNDESKRCPSDRQKALMLVRKDICEIYPD